MNKSRRVPLTSGAIVDRDEFLEIIDQMRITIPRQIEQARRIEEDADTVLSLAHEEAKRVVDQARVEAQRVLSERGLLEEAEKRSASMFDGTLRQAEGTMRGADEYAITVLGELEDQLIALQTTIRNGLDMLQEEGRRRREAMESEREPAATGSDIEDSREQFSDS